MAQMITARYEHGVLNPLVPLDLHEHQMVNVKIIQIQPVDTGQKILMELIAAGIVTPPERPAPDPPVSDTDREALSRQLGKGIQKPLSEIIIEERGQG